jgi:hypothetical protein
MSEENSNVVRVDTRIPSDPMDIKQKMLELQNYYSDIAEYVCALQFMYDQGENALSYVRDRSLVDADADKNYSSKAANIKVSFGKTNFKYPINIKSPAKHLLKDVTGEYTYCELKDVVSLLYYKFNRSKSKLDEIKSAIEVCKFYPLKGL